jgi:hypothetical protein
MPPLLPSAGSGRNAETSSFSASEMSSVCGQINVEVLFTLLANFTLECPSFMDVMTPYISECTVRVTFKYMQLKIETFPGQCVFAFFTYGHTTYPQHYERQY